MLKLLEVSISHNKRFKSGLIDQIVYTPESSYQVIVGPNGAGKSALLDELTSYPSPSASFYKNGESRRKLQLDGVNYECVSDFRSGSKHEFWKEGVNLNEGGTLVVQKDLLAKHLNITELSHQIATDKLVLSSMSPAKRQEVFSQLINQDLTLAYSLFNKARTKLRDATGAKRMLEDSLVNKQTMNLSDEEYEMLQVRLAEYQGKVTELLTDYSEQNGTSMTIDQIMGQWMRFTEGDLKNWGKYLPDSPIDAADEAVFNQKMETLRLSLNQLRTQGAALQEEYDNLDDTVKRLGDSSAENVEKLQDERDYHLKRIARLEHSADNYMFRPDIYSPEMNFGAAKEELKRVFTRWSDALSSLTPNTEGKYTRNNLEEIQRRIRNGKESYNALVFQRQRAEEQLEHFTKGEQIHCPQCSYQWTPGTKPEDKPRLVAKISQLNEQIAKGDKYLSELTATEQEIVEWSNLYREVISLEKGCSAASELFNQIHHEINISEQPVMAVGMAHNLIEDLERFVEIENSRKVIQETETILQRLRDNNVTGVDQLKKRMEHLRVRLSDNAVEQDKLIVVLNGMEQQARQIARFNEKAGELEERYEHLCTEGHRTINNVFNQVRKILIADLQGHIGTISKQLNDVKTLRDQIADNEKQLAEQQRLIVGYSKIVEDLSPKSGIIAEQMSEFIETFVGQMNEVIAEIWTYPMEIMMGKPTDSELSYVFPVYLPESDSIVPDVKETSDGQIGIIDFAFKVTAMMYLNQVNVPLLLDEVDRPLQPAHKAKLINFISGSVENERFSQVFLISHHEGSHGALPFPDIIDFNYREPREESNKVISFH
ncbi:putative RecN-like DNA repair protein [Serratia phage BUCT660]|nr:putative RecN-like DNA repair protein [Serratia phage BUCT660]